ncbi:glycosyltransferase family 8 protein [bacterium]|nr:glycosyltransferase family 8 protein [bacterium]
MAKIPIVLTFDKRIVLAGAVAIRSLIANAKPETEYDIYVYHPDIDDKTIKEYQKLTEGTKHKITFEYISKEKFANAPINKGGSWTEIVYYRLLIPELLPQYDKVIYFDTDAVILGDLEEVYNEDLGDYDCSAVAMEINNENMISHRYFPENKHELTFISSFIVFNNKKMRETNFVQKIYENIEKFKTRLKFFDVDLLNLTCEKIKPLKYRYGVFQSIYYHDDFTKGYEYSFLKHVYSDDELQKEKENTIMLHFAGNPGKPWRFKNPPQEFLKYQNEIPKKLVKYTFRDIRKKLFSKV